MTTHIGLPRRPARMATTLCNRVRGSVAWALTDAEREQVRYKFANQHGTRYVFRDASECYVPRGSATIAEVRH